MLIPHRECVHVASSDAALRAKEPTHDYAPHPDPSEPKIAKDTGHPDLPVPLMVTRRRPQWDSGEDDRRVANFVAQQRGIQRAREAAVLFHPAQIR